MIVLSEPVPAKIVSAIEEAIKLLPGIYPQAMHDRMTKLYSWMDVAKRTEVVYNAAVSSTQSNDLQDRLPRYYSCGPWAGKLFCLVVIFDYIVGLFLQWWQAAEEIDIVPPYLPRTHGVQGSD